MFAHPAVRFVLIGGGNTALSFVVFQTVLRLLGRRAGAPALAQALGYLVGMGVGYAAHRRVTFRSDGEVGRQLPRFVAVNATLLAFTTVALEILVARAGFPASASWLGVMIASTLANFELQRRFVFAAR